MLIRTCLKAPVLALALALAVGLGGCAGDGSRTVSVPPEAVATVSPQPADGELVVGIAGMITPKEGLAYYKEFSEYIGKKVGRKVRIVHKADYAETNKLLEEGKIDIAFVCSGPYVAGHDDYNLELIAAPVVNGVPAYYSYIIVPKSSPATSLASLKGHSFAFADPQSNTGKLVPTYMLAKMGTTPEQFFSKTVFSYGHDNSIKLVADGQIDGAAVDSLIWDYANATNPVNTSKTRILTKSDPYPIPPVVARPGLDGSVKRAVREAFLGAAFTKEGRALLDKMHVESFVAIEDKDYDPIRRMNEWIKANTKP